MQIRDQLRFGSTPDNKDTFVPDVIAWIDSEGMINEYYFNQILDLYGKGDPAIYSYIEGEEFRDPGHLANAYMVSILCNHNFKPGPRVFSPFTVETLGRDIKFDAEKGEYYLIAGPHKYIFPKATAIGQNNIMYREERTDMKSPDLQNLWINLIDKGPKRFSPTWIREFLPSTDGKRSFFRLDWKEIRNLKVHSRLVWNTSYMSANYLEKLERTLRGK